MVLDQRGRVMSIAGVRLNITSRRNTWISSWKERESEILEASARRKMGVAMEGGWCSVPPSLKARQKQRQSGFCQVVSYQSICPIFAFRPFSLLKEKIASLASDKGPLCSNFSMADVSREKRCCLLHFSRLFVASPSRYSSTLARGMPLRPESSPRSHGRHGTLTSCPRDACL